MKKITYSMFTSWLSCRQKFDFRYNRNIVPKENATALSFGSAVHEGLEAWFRTGDAELAVELARRDDLSEFENAKAKALVKAYCEHYQNDVFKVVAVEYEFATPLTNPKTRRKSKTWELSGKIDGVVEKDGELFILEHKTASNANCDYIDRIDIDLQIAFYAIAIQELFGERVAGAIYDIIQKPLIRLKTGEEIEAFKTRLEEGVTEENFIRHEVRFNQDFLSQRHEMIWNICKEMIHGTICPNTTECLKYSACPYLQLCRHGGNLEACSELYTSRAPHEELSNAKQ